MSYNSITNLQYYTKQFLRQWFIYSVILRFIFLNYLNFSVFILIQFIKYGKRQMFKTSCGVVLQKKTVAKLTMKKNVVLQIEWDKILN